MNSKNQTIKVGISVGDINGIGLEIILKTLQNKDILEFFTPVVFGSAKLLNQQAQKLGLQNLPIQKIANATKASPNRINVVNIFPEEVKIEAGKPSEEAGKLAIQSFTEATDALKKDWVDILVTAPFDKNTIQSNTFSHPGHTEYLGAQFNGEALMLLFGDQLRVALVTQHIPISEVSKAITVENIIHKAKIFDESLKKDFYINQPKIAILGLNPHAGDNGLIGKEDLEIVSPAVQELQKQKILAYGPYPSDSFFIPSKYDNFDGILAMYHDQGLIPFKMLHFNDGVNFTAGLDKIRTSPDHGVAYDIAGKGIADETSFREAIFAGIDIFNNRKQYLEDTKNPLLPQHKPEDENKKNRAIKD